MTSGDIVSLLSAAECKAFKKRIAAIWTEKYTPVGRPPTDEMSYFVLYLIARRNGAPTKNSAIDTVADKVALSSDTVSKYVERYRKQLNSFCSRAGETINLHDLQAVKDFANRHALNPTQRYRRDATAFEHAQRQESKTMYETLRALIDMIDQAEKDTIMIISRLRQK